MIVKPKTTILGINIDNISKEEMFESIKEIIDTNQKAIFSYVNLFALNLGFEIPWFRHFLNQSHVVYCDGFGVHVGARLTGQKLDYRFTLPDFIDSLCQMAMEENWGLFFLGAKPGITELAAKKMKLTFPELSIATFHGFFNKEGEENLHSLELVNKSSAQILLVGMGMPLQEKWIKENIQKLCNVNVILPVGALFDYVAGEIPRGPKLLTDHGFEWLTRLIIEPKRLWQRYLIGIPVTLLKIIRYRYQHDNENL